MTTPVAGPRRVIRSFVHRARGLSSAQRKTFQDLWERYGRTLPEDGFRPGDLFARPGPISLEIGFGHGETLLHEATTHPQHNVLGIEVHRPALFTVLREAERLELDNLRVMSGDAALLLPRFSDQSLQQIRILFPDPWPKRRHHKRRLIREDFVAECARCLAPGGLLHLATDWPDYARQMEQVVMADGRWQLRGKLPERPETHFERRGRRLGHPIEEWAFERMVGAA